MVVARVSPEVLSMHKLYWYKTSTNGVGIQM